MKRNALLYVTVCLSQVLNNTLYNNFGCILQLPARSTVVLQKLVTQVAKDFPWILGKLETR